MHTVERILITVKTYPTISEKYLETVCTGGINTKGQWRRIYPVNFRYLDEPQQYKVFDEIEVSLASEGVDSRPESRKPNLTTLKVLRQVGDWDARYQWVMPTSEISMRTLLEHKRTLAPVQVSEVLDLVAVKTTSVWTPKQQEKLKQELLFDARKPLEKIPWDFRIRWRDGEGIEHNNLFTSWEICETFRNFRRLYDDPIVKVKEKWMDDLFSPNRQICFFMGNMARFHENFLICGTFTPPKRTASNGTLFN